MRDRLGGMEVWKGRKPRKGTDREVGGIFTSRAWQYIFSGTIRKGKLIGRKLSYKSQC